MLSVNDYISSYRQDRRTISTAAPPLFVYGGPPLLRGLWYEHMHRSTHLYPSVASMAFDPLSVINTDRVSVERSSTYCANLSTMCGISQQKPLHEESRVARASRHRYELPICSERATECLHGQHVMSERRGGISDQRWKKLRSWHRPLMNLLGRYEPG